MLTLLAPHIDHLRILVRNTKPCRLGAWLIVRWALLASSKLTVGAPDINHFCQLVGKAEAPLVKPSIL